MKKIIVFFIAISIGVTHSVFCEEIQISIPINDTVNFVADQNFNVVYLFSPKYGDKTKGDSATMSPRLEFGEFSSTYFSRGRKESLPGDKFILIANQYFKYHRKVLYIEYGPTEISVNYDNGDILYWKRGPEKYLRLFKSIRQINGLVATYYIDL